MTLGFISRPMLATTCWGSVLVVALTGCTTVLPEGQREAVSALVQGRTTGVPVHATALAPTPGNAPAPDDDPERRLTALLAQPLSAEAAVTIALLNNPRLQASFATLHISEAARAQAGLLPNPHLAFSSLVEGETLSLERTLRLDVLGLLTLPWRMQWQNHQHALAQLEAAQDVIRLAADTRKAWVQAVAAQQMAEYSQTARTATEAAAELAHRMTQAGNWSRYQQAREQLQLAEASVQLTRAQYNAVSRREQLARLLGVDSARLQLPMRLPELPASARTATDVEATALRERLDVRAAVDASRYTAETLGLTRVTGFVSGLDLGIKHNTGFDNASGSRTNAHGWELELPLPIFDWGSARNARAEGLYLQSAARVREVAVRARSEARQAWQGWQSAYMLARQYRDEIVPLRQRLNDETLLRYNGMLLSAWDLLADTRAQALAVSSAIEAQRDFWIADTDLQTALTGTSPGALSTFNATSPTGNTASADTAGH